MYNKIDNKFSLKSEIKIEPITRSKKINNKFLPAIPWPLLCKASNLPAKSLHTFLAIWFLKAVNNSNTIKLETKHLKELGVKRGSSYTALKHLEEIGLIEVQRHAGRLPIIKIN